MQCRYHRSFKKQMLPKKFSFTHLGDPEKSKIGKKA